MKTARFSGLFEDEVSDVLRSAGPDYIIRSGPFSWEPMRIMIEDGIYTTSAAGYVTEYINGIRSGIRPRSALVSRLAHTDFEIMEV